MRKQFFKSLIELTENDRDIIFLTGDLGFSFFEEYREKFPKQFINVGCIEQSMIGIAAGLALAGKKPYCYSNAIFLLMRTYEQVRNDVCYNNLDVKLIGTGAAGFLGFSHNCSPSNEDELILKHLPNIKLIFPTNKIELRRAMEINGPAYIRI